MSGQVFINGIPLPPEPVYVHNHDGLIFGIMVALAFAVGIARLFFMSIKIHEIDTVLPEETENQ